MMLLVKIRLNLSFLSSFCLLDLLDVSNGGKNFIVESVIEIYDLRKTVSEMICFLQQTHKNVFIKFKQIDLQIIYIILYIWQSNSLFQVNKRTE